MMTDYTAGGVFGIVLLPVAPFDADLRSFSEILHQCAASHVVLNESDTIPHATLIHLECTRQAAESIWTEVVDDVRTLDSVESASFYALPGSGKIWTGVALTNPPPLDALHRSIAAVARARNTAILTPHDDDHWPHITCGRWNEMPSARIPIEQAPLGTIRVVGALAHMNAHGTVRNVLARTEGLENR